MLLLSSDDCRFNGQVFETIGGRVTLYEGWTPDQTVVADHTWTLEELRAATGDWPVGPAPMPKV